MANQGRQPRHADPQVPGPQVPGTRASAEAPRPTPPAAPGATGPTAADAIPSLERQHRFGHGFSYRREAFGGILYHYEGVQPDPRVTFVDNGFLLDLLDALAANPGSTPQALLDAVRERFALDAAECARLESFFLTLIQRGALVPVDQLRG